MRKRADGAPPGTDPWRLALAGLRRDRVGMAFISLLVLTAALCLAAPLYASVVADTTQLENHLTDTVAIAGEQANVVDLDGTPIGPTWRSQYLLGADGNGRDLAVRVLYAGRNSLAIGFAAGLLALVIGTFVGMLAGYAGGRIDGLLMRAIDVIWAFPVLLMAAAAGTAVAVYETRLGPLGPATTGKLLTVLLIGVGTSPYVARAVRSQVQTLRGQPFADAAVLGGLGHRQIMIREMLPNLAFGLVALLTVLVSNAIVLEAALSFLGAGVRPPEPSLGSMLYSGSAGFLTSPHLLVVPGVMLATIMLCISLVGDAARRALDPHDVSVGKPR